jgi:hypothetical protein
VVKSVEIRPALAPSASWHSCLNLCSSHLAYLDSSKKGTILIPSYLAIFPRCKLLVHHNRHHGTPTTLNSFPNRSSWTTNRPIPLLRNGILHEDLALRKISAYTYSIGCHSDWNVGLCNLPKKRASRSIIAELLLPS